MVRGSGRKRLRATMASTVSLRSSLPAAPLMAISHALMALTTTSSARATVRTAAGRSFSGATEPGRWCRAAASLGCAGKQPQDVGRQRRVEVVGDPAPVLPQSVLAQVARVFGHERDQASLGFPGLGDHDLPPRGRLLDQLREMGLRLVETHVLPYPTRLLATAHNTQPDTSPEDHKLPDLTKLVKLSGAHSTTPTRRRRARADDSQPGVARAPMTCEVRVSLERWPSG